MNQDSAFIGSIPQIYDTYLVPLIFDSYATDLAERVIALAPERILETAAGSGVVTRAVSARMVPGMEYVATDLNQSMLDHARSRQQETPGVSWQMADALDLPFETGSFDVVVCQFGVMFYPDRMAGYREAFRVLKAGGRFLFNVWDDIEDNEFAKVIAEAVEGIFPDDPPQFLARTPYGYHDRLLIERELIGAGFLDVQFTTLTGTSTAPSPRDPAVAFCQGTPLRNEIEDRDGARLAEVTGVAERALAARFGDSGVSAHMRGTVVSATR